MREDGGPVFPDTIESIPLHMRHGREEFRLSGGISLRDLFAKEAMPGVATRYNLLPDEWDKYAKAAYQLADAMLKARAE